jgi:hypothetical protein
MEHLSHKPCAVPGTLRRLRRLEHRANDQNLYVSEDSTVYTAQNVPVGQFLEGVLTLFEVEVEAE